MAKIVLAMATTHGPQLHTTVEQWQLRVKADKARKHPFRSGMLQFRRAGAMRRARRARCEVVDGRAAQAITRAAMSRWTSSPTSGKRSAPTSPSSSATTRTRSTKPTSSIRRSWCSSATRSRTIRSRRRRRRIFRRASPKPSTAMQTDVYTEYRGVPDLGDHIIKTLMEQRVRRCGLEGLAEARPQRRLARIRPHLPPGDAR